ncbi:MAG TPA: GDSL family lipase, partial [Pirellulales bacterium]|nr:GDSL family lipase [Pirellulales bacterium]
MNRQLRPLVLASLFACFALATLARAEDKAPSTVTPEPRPDKWWTDRDASFNERVKKGDVDLIFLGDSITQGWEGAGKEAWEKSYTKRKA